MPNTSLPELEERVEQLEEIIKLMLIDKFGGGSAASYNAERELSYQFDLLPDAGEE